MPVRMGRARFVLLLLPPLDVVRTFLPLGCRNRYAPSAASSIQTHTGTPTTRLSMAATVTA